MDLDNPVPTVYAEVDFSALESSVNSGLLREPGSMDRRHKLGCEEENICIMI